MSDSKYTYHGNPVVPRWNTKRRVAGGTAIDVIATHPCGGDYPCTVNFANLKEVK